jgi:hypothetical protein
MCNGYVASVKATPTIGALSPVELKPASGIFDVLIQIQDTELEATKRPINLSFKYTACVDAVSFELLKNAIIHYYQHIIQNGDIKVKIDNDTDKKGRVVSMIIRVSVNNISAYTISIYYTICSFHVNGKNVNKFIEEDLPNITSVA